MLFECFGALGFAKVVVGRGLVRAVVQFPCDNTINRLGRQLNGGLAHRLHRQRHITGGHWPATRHTFNRLS